MRTPWLILTLLLLVPIGVVHGADVGNDRWSAPAVTDPGATQLPRLAKPLVVDGDLDEWASAACVPARCRSYAEIIQMPGWRGPADAGLEFYCAWNTSGICVGAVVADNDVRNDREDKDLWQQDCLEIFADGRSGNAFMKAPYGPGAYQFLIRPPTADRGPHIIVKPPDGDMAGLKVAGKRTATGYVVEAIIPWSAFPESPARPGAEFGLNFRLDDYDAGDKQGHRHSVLTYGDTADLWENPGKLIRWVLDERLRTGPEVALGPLAALDFPAIFGYGKSLPVSVEVGRLLSGRVGSMRVTATDTDGNVAFDHRLRVSSLPDPWRRSVGVRTDLAPELPTDGYHVVSVVVYDRDRRPLGFASRPVLFVGRTVEDALARLRDADLPGLAQEEPFTAAAYLGAGACLEKLKRGLELLNVPTVVEARRELMARLDVLEDGKLDQDDQGLNDLLVLTGMSDAQVVVEYPNSWTGTVTFYWGAIPLASATVTQFGSEEAAAAAVDPKAVWKTTEAMGRRLVSVQCPVKAVAERAIALIRAGQPVTPADVDSMRADLVKALAPAGEEGVIPYGRSLFCGDLHMHTFYSDGTPSPAGIALQTMYCFMDFAALTDHNTIEGARVCQALLERFGVRHPFIIGEEITTEWAHLNAYPLTQVVPWDLSPYDTIKAAHVQGAVIHWNHPAAIHSPWSNEHLERGIGGTGLDAWEHIPPEYGAWKQAGRLPVLVGTTDTHNGTFTNAPERTIVFAPTRDGDDVAEAIRTGHSLALVWPQRDFLYGHDEMLSMAWSALAEAQSLKAGTAERLRTALSGADIPGLLRTSQPRRLRLEDYPPDE